jgi:hypothetical protein
MALAKKSTEEIEGKSGNSSFAPGIHECTLSNITRESLKNGEFDVVVVKFRSAETEHSHIIWDGTLLKPTDKKTVEERQDDFFLNLCHIFDPLGFNFQDKYLAAGANQILNTEQLFNLLSANITATHKQIPLVVKVTGSVYNGRANAGFPAYRPFLRLKSDIADKPLNFSNTELQNNEEYRAFMSKPKNNESQFAATDAANAKPANDDLPF